MEIPRPVSVAIETSCRTGGLALGLGDRLRKVIRFDASARAAAQIITRMDAMLREAHLNPNDLEEVYVSAGPGSFTALRVGITVARTLAQAIEGLRCVAVPTAWAIAEDARALKWNHLGVLLACKDRQVHASLFTRRGEDIVQAARPAVTSPREFLARAPRPILLVGEALAFCQPAGPQVTIAPGDPSADHLPTPRGVWRVGRRLAKKKAFTEYHRLLPIYARKPEAVRLWQQKEKRG